ncbi:MAG: Rieske (2Fe-2S) protein [Rhodovibrionaceae bacterium]
MSWAKVAAVDEVESKGRLLVKPEGKQIALFAHNGRIYACDNSCPHEGYPLSVGTLGADCHLTCNWHNWKFDLATGRTLNGGDNVRIYPVRLEDGAIWLDLTEPPLEDVIHRALVGLKSAFRYAEEDRMARELGRIQAAGGDPIEAVQAAVDWTFEHLEFGTGHAYAAAADWLRLRARDAEGEAERLVPLVEAVLHMAWDLRAVPRFAYPQGSAPYDAAALLAAIEAQDEAAAVARLRGALSEGLDHRALRPAFAAAALAHYQGFGHAAIYTVKTGELIAQLGKESQEPLLLALTRYLIETSREDLIPEFRSYAPALAKWRAGADAAPPAEDFVTGSVAQILERIAGCGAAPEALYRSLLRAAALQMLRFDLSRQDRSEGPVSQNIGWLDFTHAITFANAGRQLAEETPRLWPQVLLQIGCFLGRNSGFLGNAEGSADWAVDDPEAFLAEARRGLFDHRAPEPIVAAHLVKLLTAITEEVERAPEAETAPALAAAAKRFLNTPLRRKHALRSAHQALALVGS